MALTNVYTNFGGRIVHESRKGVEYGYVPDPLGSTVALVDTTGAVTDTWEYWPYGEVEVHQGESTTPFTFVGTLGYFRDLVSSLTYVRARFYQALIGQWMTMDPIWPRQFAYEYVDDRPQSKVDPSGLGVVEEMLCCLKWAGLGALGGCLLGLPWECLACLAAALVSCAAAPQFCSIIMQICSLVCGSGVIRCIIGAIVGGLLAFLQCMLSGVCKPPPPPEPINCLELCAIYKWNTREHRECMQNCGKTRCMVAAQNVVSTQ